MQVEVCKWTGSSLELCSPLVSGNPRLITSLAMMSNKYMLVGNLRKGFAFVEFREDKYVINLLSRDFGCADASAVEFLLEDRVLGFVHADFAGHFAVFMFQRSGSVYEPAGIKALPVGHFYVGHQVPCIMLNLCTRLCHLRVWTTCRQSRCDGQWTTPANWQARIRFRS